MTFFIATHELFIEHILCAGPDMGTRDTSKDELGKDPCLCGVYILKKETYNKISIMIRIIWYARR